MLIIRIFLVAILFQNVLAMEEPLPDWLKVYQQNSTKNNLEGLNFPSESESELTTVSELDEFINTEKSEEDQLREQIKKDFPSKLRLRDFIREMFKQKKYAEVVPFLQEILQREPGHHEMLYKMAYSLRRLKKLEASLSYYESLLQVKPNFRDAWYERSLTLQGLKRYEEALESFNKALEFNQNASWIHYDRGILLKRMKRYQDSIASFSKALELRPKHSWSYLELGNIFFARGQYVHAMNYYRKTLDLNPKAPGVENNLKICIQRLESN